MSRRWVLLDRRYLTYALLGLIATTAVYFLMNGAQIFETALIVPSWTSAPPESLGMFQGRHRLDFKVFWIAFHSVSVPSRAIEMVQPPVSPARSPARCRAPRLDRERAKRASVDGQPWPPSRVCVPARLEAHRTKADPGGTMPRMAHARAASTTGRSGPSPRSRRRNLSRSCSRSLVASAAT